MYERMTAHLCVSINLFRTLYPVHVFARECFTHMSSPFMDRALATVSQLCLVKQVELFLKEDLFDYALFAQLFCWMGVFTQNYMFHVYEKYLWFLIGYTCYWNDMAGYSRDAAFCYCVYILVMDIPQTFSLVDSNMSLHECVYVQETPWEMIGRTAYFVGMSSLSMYLS